jgi:hypothetical protein
MKKKTTVNTRLNGSKLPHSTMADTFTHLRRVRPARL